MNLLDRGRFAMKKIILLFSLSLFSTSCQLWNLGEYRECTYDGEKEAFYKSVYDDNGEYVGNVKCNIKPR